MSGKKIVLWRAFSLLALIGLVACDSQSIDSQLTDTGEPVVLDGTDIQVPLPQRLRTVSAIDLNAVSAVVTIDGIESQLQPTAPGQSGGQFSGQITVPARSSFTVVIDFYEMFAGQRLALARAEKVVTTSNGNASLNLQNEDYDFNLFDFDRDNASNLLERQFDTNPLDSSQVPDFVEVEVFAALPVAATNAGYTNYQIEASVGAEAVTADAVGGPLSHTFRVPRRDSLAINVRLIENVSGRSIVFGTQARQVANPPESIRVVFDGTGYTFDTDEDADGVTDLDELIAGTDLLSTSELKRIPFTVLFNVPPEIANPNSAFAVLEINGANVSLSRMENTYTATALAIAGSSISIEAQVNDTFQGDVISLATFSGNAMPSAGETLQLEGFSLQLDEDNDGIANYLELAQGSDPFNSPDQQCTPVMETEFATLTDDGYQQNNRLFDNNTLQVSQNRRTILIRYSYDESLGSVIAASLSLTVTTDEGSGLLSLFSVQDFEWSDNASSVILPALGAPVGSREDFWLEDVEYSFNLNPDVVSSDFTLFIEQENGNDVAFGSSDTTVPPSLELLVERCE